MASLQTYACHWRARMPPGPLLSHARFAHVNSPPAPQTYPYAVRTCFTGPEGFWGAPSAAPQPSRMLCWVLTLTRSTARAYLPVALSPRAPQSYPCAVRACFTWAEGLFWGARSAVSPPACMPW